MRKVGCVGGGGGGEEGRINRLSMRGASLFVAILPPPKKDRNISCVGMHRLIPSKVKSD